jgi:hypothetical protein
MIYWSSRGEHLAACLHEHAVRNPILFVKVIVAELHVFQSCQDVSAGVMISVFLHNAASIA